MFSESPLLNYLKAQATNYKTFSQSCYSQKVEKNSSLEEEDGNDLTRCSSGNLTIEDIDLSVAPPQFMKPDKY
jgi:hypothetical protein